MIETQFAIKGYDERKNEPLKEGSIIYSGTTTGKLKRSLEERDGKLLFDKQKGITASRETYFTSLLADSVGYAIKNYLETRNGKPIILEGPVPTNYSQDFRSNGNTSFVTKDKLIINAIWLPTNKLSDPGITILDVYNGKLKSEFRRKILDGTNLEELEEILRLHN